MLTLLYRNVYLIEGTPDIFKGEPCHAKTDTPEYRATSPHWKFLGIETCSKDGVAVFFEPISS